MHTVILSLCSAEGWTQGQRTVLGEYSQPTELHLQRRKPYGEQPADRVRQENQAREKWKGFWLDFRVSVGLFQRGSAEGWDMTPAPVPWASSRGWTVPFVPTPASRRGLPLGSQINPPSLVAFVSCFHQQEKKPTWLIAPAEFCNKVFWIPWSRWKRLADFVKNSIVHGVSSSY